jgi:hypothetical protein
MKMKYQLAIALLTGAVIGGAAIQGLHAQAKPPAFVVAEIDVTNQEGFAKEFGPAARKALAIGAGYKALVLGARQRRSTERRRKIASSSTLSIMWTRR